MRQAPIVIASEVDMSDDFSSIGLNINQQFGWSIQAIWTGEPEGTLFIQVSNDPVPTASSPNNPAGPDPAANVVNWTVYSNSSVSTDGDDGDWMWVSQIPPYNWVRLSFTSTSGTGSLDAVAFIKGG